MERIGQGFEARKKLFHKGLKEGRLSVRDIEEALPPGSLSPAERWLFYYCVRAADIAIVDETSGKVDTGWHGTPLAP